MPTSPKLSVQLGLPLLDPPSPTPGRTAVTAGLQGRSPAPMLEAIPCRRTPASRHGLPFPATLVAAGAVPSLGAEPPGHLGLTLGLTRDRTPHRVAWSPGTFRVCHCLLSAPGRLQTRRPALD